MNQGSFLTLPQNFTTLEVNHNLQDLYSYISTSFGIDPTSFYLTAKGKPLNPAHTILDYGLKPDSLIEINYRCYGGQPTGISTSKPLPRNKRRRDVKRNTTLELLNRIHRGINTGGAQTFEQQMNSLKKEIDNSINRDSEKFWDVIGIQLFDTPITRIASCNTEKDTLIVAEQSNNIHYYSIKKRKTKHKFPVPLRDDEKICALALSHSDKYVIIGTTSCSIFIYNRKKRDHYQTIDTDAADDLKIRKIKAITTVKTIKDQQSETHAYHSSLNDNDDERTSLLKAQIDQDEYMVIHDEFEGLIFINMADWRPNADLNGYGKFKSKVPYVYNA